MRDSKVHLTPFLAALVLITVSCGHDHTAPLPSATQLTFTTTLANTAAGASISPAIVVTAKDASGAPVTSFVGNVMLAIGTNPGSATLAGTTTAAAVAGVATFSNVSLNRVGAGYTLTASSGTLTGATSTSFSVTPGAASAVAKNGGDQQSGFGAIALPTRLTVTVTDALSNPVPNTTVNWAAATGGGSVSAAASVTDSLGVAAITWTLGSTLGAQTATAAVNGAAGAPATFTATGIAFAFASLAPGGDHTCGLSSTGGAYCWGFNADGEVGDSTTNHPIAPIAVHGGHTFTSLAGGEFDVCGLVTGGAAFCWGANNPSEYGYSGSVGDGTTVQRLIPTAVSGGLTFTALGAGDLTACGLTAGAAYCWGANLYGEVGDGTTTDRLVPTPVTGGLAFTSISVGPLAVCGLIAGGAAYCWGNNTLGEIGDGTTTSRSSPVAVAGGLSFASIVSGGDFHTCALTSAGAAYCWGSNLNGELGDGTTTQHTTPMPVAGGVVFASLALSQAGHHSCGLTAAGAAYCWGLNSSGQLGDGTTTQRLTPTAVAGGLAFASITAGKNHTCGLTAAGVAYCWGSNSSTQLGDGTATNRTVPTAVVP